MTDGNTIVDDTAYILCRCTDKNIADLICKVLNESNELIRIQFDTRHRERDSELTELLKNPIKPDDRP